MTQELRSEADFDLGGLILNAAVGALITFAFIGLAVLTAGTSVILTGALIGAAVGSGVCTAVITVQDAIDGDVRSLGEAVSQIALSALVAFKNLLGLKLGSQFISATLIKAGMYGIAGLNAIFAGNNIIGIGSGIDILGSTVFKNHQDLYQFIQFSIAYASMYILRMGMVVEQAQRAQNTQNLGDTIVFGSDTKSTTKLQNQMTQRGWTETTVRSTVSQPFTTRDTTNLAIGNPATVYYNEADAYIIIDDITRAVVQVSDNINPSTWIPDPNIIDPYLP